MRVTLPTSLLPAIVFSRPLLRARAAMAAPATKSSAHAPAADSTDASFLIRAHQEAAARLSPVEEVRTILDYSIHGMLLTFSQDHMGYPSGSMVDYACDHDGSPILAISSLAVHSKNLLGNPNCSLLVFKDPNDRTDIVVTLYGDAIFVSESKKEAVLCLYLEKHPDAVSVDFNDYYFIHIKARFVSYSSDATMAQLKSGEFSGEEYRAAKVDPIAKFSHPIASHMNKDHAEATKTIVQHSTSVKVDFACMLDVDNLGFNVKAGYEGNTLKLRIPFPRPAVERKDVKTIIVEMLHAAQASSP